MATHAGALLLWAGVSTVAVALGCQPAGDSPAPSTSGGRAEPKVQPMILHAANAVQWSAPIGRETRKALRSGSRRLSIEVRAYDPPTSGAVPIVVQVLSKSGKQGKELGQFSIHPNIAFRASDHVEPQRFEFSLADFSEFLEGSELHIEIGFARDKGEVKGGMAEIAVSFIDL